MHLESLGRIPPHNVEAEKVLLGSMIFDNTIIPDVFCKLQADEFYREDHREIFSAIQELFNAGKGIDLITVSEQLKAQSTFDRVGGYNYITELIDMVITSANYNHYIEIIKDRALKRKYIKAASDIVSMAYDEVTPVAEVQQAAEQRILDITINSGQNMPTIQETTREAMKQLHKRIENKGALPGKPSGFRFFDYKIGGLDGFIVVAARPSMGKTSFGQGVAWYLADYLKEHVLFFSVEMSREKIINRLISGVGAIDNNKLKTGTLTKDEIERAENVARRIEQSRLHIDDTPGISVQEIASKARRLTAKVGKLGLILIDHLTELKIAGKNERQEISENVRALKRLGKQLGCPVMLLCQLSRAVESRQSHRPQLSDLRETGVVEETADIVAFLYREAYYNPEADPREAEVIISKCRDGETGTVKLHWYGQYTTFKNPESQPF